MYNFKCYKTAHIQICFVLKLWIRIGIEPKQIRNTVKYININILNSSLDVPIRYQLSHPGPVQEHKVVGGPLPTQENRFTVTQAP